MPLQTNRLISLQELAYHLNWTTTRVEYWLKEQPGDLIVYRNGKKSVDPIILAELLSDRSSIRPAVQK